MRSCVPSRNPATGLRERSLEISKVKLNYVVAKYFETCLLPSSGLISPLVSVVYILSSTLCTDISASVHFRVLVIETNLQLHNGGFSGSRRSWV